MMFSFFSFFLSFFFNSFFFFFFFCLIFYNALRKQAYSNILKILPPKNDSFLKKKNLIFFIFLLKNIDCGYSLEPFLSRNKENNVYPCKPQFYYIKVGFKGVKII